METGMRVGIDTFSLHPLELDAFGQLDWIAAHGFDGAQFGRLGDDPGKLRDVRARADELGLYSHVSVTSPNPHLSKGTEAALVDRIAAEVARAAACGWRELHSSLGDDATRYRHDVPWPQHLADAARVLSRLAPCLRDHGSRINLEPHGDATTWELARLAEDVGGDVCGVCLDTANVLCFAEDPVAAARRAAPYTHLTHTKDAILYFCGTGVRRQGRPPGEGVLDWETILPILAEHEPELPLSIEDHKWLFDARIFDPSWLAQQPDLTRDELAEFVRLAWTCQEVIERGALPDPEAYEAVPYATQMEARLGAGRDHLRELLSRLGIDEAARRERAEPAAGEIQGQGHDRL